MGNNKNNILYAFIFLLIGLVAGYLLSGPIDSQKQAASVLETSETQQSSELEEAEYLNLQELAKKNNENVIKLTEEEKLNISKATLEALPDSFVSVATDEPTDMMYSCYVNGNWGYYYNSVFYWGATWIVSARTRCYLMPWNFSL